MKEAQVLTHIHRVSYQLAPKGVLLFTGLVRLLLERPSAQSPFGRKSVASCAVMSMPHVSGHYPTSLATPGSCAV